MSILCEFSSVGYVRQWVVFGPMCISWKEEIWPSPYTSKVGHLSIMVDISCTVTCGSFSLYSRTINCPSPYTVGLLPLLLDWWPSPCTAGRLPILFTLYLYCWPSPYTIGLLPNCWSSPYSVGLVECGYGILLAFSLGYSN